jgi:hypothetical protein
MKKLLVVLLCSILVVAVIAGCGQQEESGEAEDMSAGGHADEMADTTRMDEEMMDTTMADSMMEEAEAVEEGEGY